MAEFMQLDSDTNSLTFFQDPAVTSDFGAQIWPTSVAKLTNDQTAAKLLSSGENERRIFFFKCRGIIEREWRCKAEDALPEMLLGSTAYSLALLLQLRMLASCAKNDYKNAQAILISQWKLRMQLLQLPLTPTEPKLQNTVVSHVLGTRNESSGQRSRCEEQIWENIHGLTLVDVTNAIATAKQLYGALTKAIQRDKPIERVGALNVSDDKLRDLSRRERKKTDRRARKHEMREKQASQAEVNAVEGATAKVFTLPVRAAGLRAAGALYGSTASDQELEKTEEALETLDLAK